MLEGREPDETIIAKIKSGDTGTFEQLVNDYKRMVYHLAMQSSQNQEDASDISQEVFLKIYRSIGSFEGKSALSTWIWRVAQNVCVDFARKNAPQKRNISMTVGDEQQDNEQWEFPDSSYEPEKLCEQKEISEHLRSAIDRLSPSAREIVILRDLRGLKYEEIAQTLEIEMGTVRSRLSRARLRLRELLLEDL